MESFASRTGGEDPLGAFVAQLMQTTGCLMLIVEHMMRAAARRSAVCEGPAFDDVLATLLHDTLEPLVRRHGELRLRAAAALLEEARETVAEEIYRYAG